MNCSDAGATSSATDNNIYRASLDSNFKGACFARHLSDRFRERTYGMPTGMRYHLSVEDGPNNSIGYSTPKLVKAMWMS